MNKSTITREQLLEIIETDHVQCGEASYLARMALAAMDSSESVELPLDYLQGHKDGLEWAAQLAEANHPETGDWLYDDPIELAKAIRKGPDMPPAQPAADSEPDRNPVLAYADSYRDMAKQGVESVPIWSVITDIERNIAPLYRHSQPAPVVPDELKEAAADFLTVLDEFPEQLVPINRDSAVVRAMRAAMLQGSNYPVVPDGYVMVPINMTTEQMRAVQRDSTLGTFASAHLKGAFDLYREFWSVAVAASPQEFRKSNVVGTYRGADGKEHEIIYLTSSQKELK